MRIKANTRATNFRRTPYSSYAQRRVSSGDHATKFCCGTGESGFTLVELMITFAILGFILLIIFGAFRLGLSSWDRGEEMREQYQRQRISTEMISRQIKSAVPYKVKTEMAEGDYLAFEGKSRSLKFVSALSLRAGQPNGFVFVIYEFQDGGQEAGNLVVYEKRVTNKNFFESGPGADEEGVAVLEGLSDLGFEYYREEDAQKTREEGWFPEWSARDEKELPRAMRMTFTFRGGRSGTEETSFKLLSCLSANRFEDIQAAAAALGLRPPMSMRPTYMGGN